MDMKTVEEELKRGWEATSQLRALLFPPQLECGIESSNRELNRYYDNELIIPFLESQYTTIINSFNTSISILKQFSESSKPSINHKINRCRKSRYVSEISLVHLY